MIVVTAMRHHAKFGVDGQSNRAMAASEANSDLGAAQKVASQWGRWLHRLVTRVA
jgi:hypothetical protein